MTGRNRIGAFTCNPVDLSYRFQDLRPAGGERTVHREAADPSVVRYRGRYLMFASMTAGFWHSTDLSNWTYQPSENLPAFDYAPDVREVDGTLVISASRTTESPFFRSVDPLSDDFVQINDGFVFWDPHVFQDEDGATYFYWGCSNKEPIAGVRVDPVTFDVIGEQVPLITGVPDRHGWEQIGENYVKAEPKTERERMIAEYLGDAPFIEGAWMTRIGDDYYLQYAGPGTEWNTYADGYYVGKSPLGPFEYSPHSPFSSKPGGFITGAGHGSTFQDEHGNWWHASTMRISVHHAFERRIGIFPAGFDADGALFCNQNFADYPTVVPDGPFDPWKDAFAGWMLQSYRASATASSALPGHEPALAVDEDVRRWWVAEGDEPGEWLQLDFSSVRTLHAIQVNFADHELAAVAPETTHGQQSPGEYRAIYPGTMPTEYVVEASRDGRTWETVVDNRGQEAETPHGFVVLDAPVRARYVRLTSYATPFGAAVAVSGLRVFGLGDGAPPPAVTPRAVRTSERSADLGWDTAASAQGYNIRYGIAPDKLYHSWLVYDQTDLILPSLNAGHDYWVAIDAFNENGITAGEPVLISADPS
ncbi:family 43 glycosylhydrolase [Demequina muriae]|uniref:Family 43 glycosylhydrolase n=1 Tax=Demequina muriae TaxID=3051664 RepID=A0ABT8GG92_9MICO|nr:family 43 glycosylhydrolase [Demequina sp. EGI L300058]MDN4480462.1 family 43 glycosylhydrolase [Demequina sp. EGI L300058]